VRSWFLIKSQTKIVTGDVPYGSKGLPGLDVHIITHVLKGLGPLHLPTESPSGESLNAYWALIQKASAPAASNRPSAQQIITELNEMRTNKLRNESD